MTRQSGKPTKPQLLNEDALDKAVGGGVNHTGGRFTLDIAGHNIGYLGSSSPTPPPPPPPPPAKP